MLRRFLLSNSLYVQLMRSRPHFQRTMTDREAAPAAFMQLGVNYKSWLKPRFDGFRHGREACIARRGQAAEKMPRAQAMT